MRVPDTEQARLWSEPDVSVPTVEQPGVTRADVGVAIVGSDRRVSEFDAGFCRLTGCSASALRALADVASVMLPADPSAARIFLDDLIEGRRERVQMEIALPGERGLVSARLTATVLNGDDAERRVAVTVEDAAPVLDANRHLRAREAETRALRRIAAAVAGSPSPLVAFDAVAREAAALHDMPSARVVRFEGVEPVVVGAWNSRGDDRSVSPAAAAHLARVAVRGRAIRVDGTSSAGAEGRPTVGMAAALIVGGVAWGAVLVAGPAEQPLVRHGDETRLEDFCELVGSVLSSADQRARDESDAVTDQLTALANHRRFHERLAEEVERAADSGRPLSLVVANLDHLHRVNERRGHSAGDRVIAEAGRRLAELAAPGEVVARLGADFAWLLPGRTALQAEESADRVLAAIAASPIEGVGPLTATAGVCGRESARDGRDLLALAQTALSWAKRNGRNQVCVYGPRVVNEMTADLAGPLEPGSTSPGALRAMARAIDALDPSTHRHSERVSTLAAQLAETLGWSPVRIDWLREAALIHDVGKIGVPSEVLFKSGALSGEEFEQIQRHSLIGADIAREVMNAEQVSWIRGHHERFDGAGYPDRLSGVDISEGARILALADAVDAMTGARHYRRPVSRLEALVECRRESGNQFCPDAVAALERLWMPSLPAGTAAGAVR